MPNWITEIVEQHKELESPQSFWYWSAIAAISAVVKDQIWMDRQIYNLYPNIYVMLHAESGLKKGPPVSMAKQLVRPVNNTRIISGRSSIQGILKDLGTGYTQPGGKIVNKSVAFICSSELSSSIVEDKVATKILTDLYDRQYNIGEWRSLLKMETFELKDPTITMLTATNEAMSEDFFTKSAIQGGYFARTFIIYEKETPVSNSLTFPLSNPPNYIASASYLKELSKLQGVFPPIGVNDKTDEYRYKKVKEFPNCPPRDVYFSEVGIVYDDWYDNFNEVKKTLEKDNTGTLNRFGDSVLKVAMILSLAHEPRLVLRLDAVHEAITQCEKLLGHVRKATLGKEGTSMAANLKARIITELMNRENHQISRAMLSKKMWTHYGSIMEFDEIMQAFDASGMIVTNSIGNQIIYTMPESQVNELRDFLKDKRK
jgi:hypothetical protein